MRKKCKDVKIGRLYMVSPREGERFYLRSLLAVRTDCVSWSELMQTPTGDQCDTFKAAALAWGLLEDDKEWVKCLEEAVLVRGGSQLRQLFVLLLTERLLVDPHAAYETFKDSLSDDFVHAGMAADDAEILLRLDVEFRLRTFNPAATLKGVELCPVDHADRERVLRLAASLPAGLTRLGCENRKRGLLSDFAELFAFRAEGKNCV